ncbi:phospholipase D-like domain-containing protein [Scytonema sp. NUACC26]|uniref:phospholipase D-like domain-containing protein n=1 Tax=Scytonema sp. NUACC26 TaxID=3140176 RepID=UPI0034DB9218
MKSVSNFLAPSKRHFKFYRNILFILLLLIGGFVLVHKFKFSSNENFVKPLPQDPFVKVYFNQNRASDYKDPYRHFIRKGDNLEQILVDAINQAQSTIDLAVMEFRLPKVAEALIAKHKSGVKVRLIIDNKYNKTWADYTPLLISRMNEHDKAAYEELKRYPTDALSLIKNSGIEIKDDTSNRAPKGSGLMHHKFMVVDNIYTIVSSGNLTTSEYHGDFQNFESRGNPNNMVVMPSNPQIAKTFTDEFNYMWQGLFKSRKPKRYPVTIPAGAGTVTINFSPASRSSDIAFTSNGVIANYIQQAKKSVHVAVFVYSDQKISNTLGKVHDNGVENIKVLVDPDFISQPYSKAYDAMGVCPRMGTRNRGGDKVKPWNNPITTVGFPISPVGDRGVHSKMAILDSMLVITGSHNWSSAGNYLNDETLIAIQNPIVAAHYEREFHRLYDNAQLGLKALPHAQKCN